MQNPPLSKSGYLSNEDLQRFRRSDAVQSISEDGILQAFDMPVNQQVIPLVYVLERDSQYL